MTSARESGQSTAGRTAVPDSSTRIVPCICPVTPTARTSYASDIGTSRSSTARSQTPGSASAVWESGRSSAHAVSCSARGEPSAPTAITLSELVPTSTPSQAGVLTLSSVAS